MYFGKFKVGFNLRPDTYTKKLGFINYKKIDDTWKHKTSYDNWIHTDIPEEEYDNDFVSGFVINNNVGYMSYGNGREPKVRILDPRGFEIEITMANFFHIISYGVSEGKMLNGSYCYAIVDERLTLINEQEFVKVKDTLKLYNPNEELVIGNIYYTSLSGKTDVYIYVGDSEETVMKRNKMVVETKPTFITYNQKYSFPEVSLTTKMNPKKFKSVDDKYKTVISESIKVNGGYQHLLGVDLTHVETKFNSLGSDRFSIFKKEFFMEIGDKIYRTDSDNNHYIGYALMYGLDKQNYYTDNLHKIMEVKNIQHGNNGVSDTVTYQAINTLTKAETLDILKDFTHKEMMGVKIFYYTYKHKLFSLIDECSKN